MQEGNTVAGDQLITLAHQMADAAGEVLRRHWRMDVAIGRKDDASPVTIADREAESVMRTLIEDAYPEHGIMGEEYGNVREDSEFQWVLDPLDGTRSFLGGYPLFTILIALTYRGMPILGIIDQPVMYERWVGIAGKKTTLGGNPVSVRACAALSEAVLVTTSMDYFTASQLELFRGLRKECINTVQGGDGYAYAMLASGHNDLVVDAGLKPYDFCALKPVLEGAGATITDWAGKPLTLNSDGTVIAAVTPQLNAQAVAHLNIAALGSASRSSGTHDAGGAAG